MSERLTENLLNLRIKGIVEIPQCGLYAKSPEALQNLFVALDKLGYEIKDCSRDEERPPRKVQERDGWYLWYASLRDEVNERKGKCNACGAYINAAGILTHKHKCEKCGEYTYLHFIDGSVVRFKFLGDDDERRAFDPTLQMKVFDYDDKLGCLLLYPTPFDGNNFNDWGIENALKVLERNKSKFQHVERDGNTFIAIKYDPYSFYKSPNAVISMYDIHGHKWNHKIVKLYQGKEYGEWDNLPIPESYSIYEAWHWMPYTSKKGLLHEKIIRAAGMVSDCGYYHQDGRPAFYDIHLLRMRLFVKNFTNIPINVWDAFIRTADKSGPGMIREMAAFCQGKTVQGATFKNKPNVANLIDGFCKAALGQRLSEGEKTAMAEAAADEVSREQFLGIFESRKAKP